jgi:hypothetical protein
VAITFLVSIIVMGQYNSNVQAYYFVTLVVMNVL